MGQEICGENQKPKEENPKKVLNEIFKNDDKEVQTSNYILKIVTGMEVQHRLHNQ